ncbi:MAG: rod shape-determining protein MreC [Bacteroidales bacterium]|nr:rod shape-determining protein MreC [Bacteroidales bacterium]
MKTLINVIIRFHLVILFLILEVISISMVISDDLEKKKVVFSSANELSGYFNKKINTWLAYFTLAQENEVLRKENLALRNRLNKLQALSKVDDKDSLLIDSVKYSYLSATVVNNSIYKAQNFITIDKGKADGVKVDCGVIGPHGVVGVVVATSEHYALVVSLLNSRFGLSAKIKNSNHFGSLYWTKNDYRFASLAEVPNHVKINKGDSIVTSGFSAIFPAGIAIGIIDDFRTNKSNNFYEIDVKLSTDFKSLYYVYVINNTMRNELLLLEKSVDNEY